MKEEGLDTFEIERSFSRKGCLYDNAVAEAKVTSYKLNFFESLEQLQLVLFDYVNWYNNISLHSVLGYLSPVDYKYLHLNKVV